MSTLSRMPSMVKPKPISQLGCRSGTTGCRASRPRFESRRERSGRPCFMPLGRESTPRHHQYPAALASLHSDWSQSIGTAFTSAGTRNWAKCDRSICSTRTPSRSPAVRGHGQVESGAGDRPAIPRRAPRGVSVMRPSPAKPLARPGLGATRHFPIRPMRGLRPSRWAIMPIAMMVARCEPPHDARCGGPRSVSSIVDSKPQAQSRTVSALPVGQ